MRTLLLAVATFLVCSTAPMAQTYSVQGANAYVQRHDWQGLLQYCQGWTRAEPSNGLAWYYMGNTYGIGLNDAADALPAFQRAAQLKRPWPEVWNALGHVYAQLERYRESAEAFEQATQQNPGKMSYWNNMASAYSDYQQWDKVVTSLDAGVRAAGANARDYEWYNVGNAYSAVREWAKASQAYERCLAMNARYGEAWNNLGVAQQYQGHADQAVRDYQQAASLGDPLGQQNATGLQNAINQARIQAQQRHSTYSVGDTIHEYNARSYQAQHPEASWTDAMHHT